MAIGRTNVGGGKKTLIKAPVVFTNNYADVCSYALIDFTTHTITFTLVANIINSTGGATDVQLNYNNLGINDIDESTLTLVARPADQSNTNMEFVSKSSGIFQFNYNNNYLITTKYNILAVLTVAFS